uniref:NHR domain-containing protein n=1 Tax=Sinocyclocheilus rhinocerous TaxID=307959 RepID=A0A673LWX4_9TELE
MCGSRCLGPMTFNKDLTGQYVTLSQGGQLASRDTSSFMNGLAFLSRTVEVDEKLCIRIEDRTSLWDGALCVGFTNICPQRNNLPPASIPDLRDTRGYCVVPVYLLDLSGSTVLSILRTLISWLREITFLLYNSTQSL